MERQLGRKRRYVENGKRGCARADKRERIGEGKDLRLGQAWLS